MEWESVVENHEMKSYFNFLDTPWGQYQVDLTPEAKIYIPTSGIWLDNTKEQLIGEIQERVHDVDDTAKMEYISRQSVFVIEMPDLDSAQKMLPEVKEVVLQFMENIE